MYHIYIYISYIYIIYIYIIHLYIDTPVYSQRQSLGHQVQGEMTQEKLQNSAEKVSASSQLSLDFHRVELTKSLERCVEKA